MRIHLIILILFPFQIVHAQYLSGNGRGDGAFIRIAHALTGEDLTLLYHGSTGRGDIQLTRYEIAVTGEVINAVYRGSSGRGDALLEIHSGFADCAVVSYWNGSISEAWQNPLNWNCNAVPGINSNVIIPPGVPRFPRVLTSTEIRSLFLSPGTTVIVDFGVQLKVNGN